MEWRSRKFWIGLFITALATWLLERLFSLTWVGTSHLWSKLVFVITLGSAKVRDAPFALAALNPYPLAPLLTFQFFALLPIFMATGFGAFMFGARLGKRDQQQRGSGQTPKRRFAWPWALAGCLLLILTSAQLIVEYAVFNEASYVRRVFEANRDILAAVVGQNQIAQLQAQFASMKTKADYQALMVRMRDLAASNHVSLRNENPAS